MQGCRGAGVQGYARFRSVPDSGRDIREVEILELNGMLGYAENAALQHIGADGGTISRNFESTNFKPLHNPL